MRKFSVFITLIFILAAATAFAQEGIKANFAAGEVSAVNQAENKIILLTKDGSIDVVLSAATIYKRVAPDNPKLSAATAALMTDVGVGDKIVVTGMVAADQKMIPAKAIYIITKADIAKKNNSEREMWRTRGITGRITAINLPTREITIQQRGTAATGNVIISPKESVEYRRYAPDSVKFDDAKASSFIELQVGDTVRALGDKSADGAKFQAEKILSGAFRMVGGKITAIDTTKNEVTIKDILTNKPVVIAVSGTSLLRKFPAEMAQMMAARMSGGGMTPGGQGGMVQMRPPNQQGNQPNPAGQNPAGNGGGMRGGRGDFDEMLDRFPAVSLADLKIGDSIAASSSASQNAERVTAIKLLSGVEAFLSAPQITRGGGQSSPSLNIPGLDGGFGAP